MSRLFCLTKSKLLVPYMPMALPSIWINLDLYRNKFSNEKYLAIRIIYNYKGVQKSWNIAIRQYSPIAAERNTTQASELLIQMDERNIIGIRDCVKRHHLKLDRFWIGCETSIRSCVQNAPRMVPFTFEPFGPVGCVRYKSGSKEK